MARRGAINSVAVGAILLIVATQAMSQQTITHSALRDKLEGGLVGQMAGVAWGRFTEAQWRDSRIPDASVPVWSPGNIVWAFSQDDLYVEAPFIDAMKDAGVNASWTTFGEYFADTTFNLWVANKVGRDNLQAGIPAPQSGHPSVNVHYEMIDWQIESNFAGAVSPGLPTAAGDIAWRGGHVMNWGDGVYGGVALATMQATAYTADSVDEIIQAGRNSLPVGSGYRELVDDMIGWHEADTDKTTWEDTWQLAQDKWGTGGAWYDAKINGAWVFLGLLYGQDDITAAMRIAMQGGDDSDCNPSSVGAIIGTYLGLAEIPDTFKSNLNRTGPTFSESDYTFDGMIGVLDELAREVVLLRGGTIAPAGGDELWTIPQDQSTALPLEKWPGASDDVPTVSIDFDRDPADRNKLNFTATASDGDGVAGVHWFLGDLSFVAGNSVTHTYDVPGDYEIIAYVTDGSGNTGWTSLMVAIFADGDFLADGDVDADDIDLLADAIRTGSTDFALFDISADGATGGTDGAIDILDLDYLVRFLVETSAINDAGDPIHGTEYGDFNLDGEIELADLTRLGTFYGVGDKWAEGNANRHVDLLIELGDLTMLGTFYGADNGGVDTIPAPATLSVMGCGAVGLLRRRGSKIRRGERRSE